jgi:hypothetical protein
MLFRNLGPVTTQNRNGLVVGPRLMLATVTAERDAAAAMIEHKPAGKPVILGGYDTAEFVEKSRGLRMTPHCSQEHTISRAPLKREPPVARLCREPMETEALFLG